MPTTTRRPSPAATPSLNGRLLAEIAPADLARLLRRSALRLEREEHAFVRWDAADNGPTCRTLRSRGASYLADAAASRALARRAEHAGPAPTALAWVDPARRYSPGRRRADLPSPWRD